MRKSFTLSIEEELQKKLMKYAIDQNLDASTIVEEFIKKLKEQGIRVEIDAANHTMQAKVRTAEEQKVPYIVIIGDQEIKAKNISIRGRGRKDLGTMTVADFGAKLVKEIEEKNE